VRDLVFVVHPRLAHLPCHALPCGLLVVEARSPRARTLGLAGLPELPAHVGLLLPNCRSIHTFGMRFALDLVWLDAPRISRVVRIDRSVQPWRIRSCRAARSVLELAAGSLDKIICQC
jgi:uncharacterized membrane protein (UPF0127 family)